MARLKKIAHVMRRLVPEKWGGTESVVFNLSKELIQQGIASPIFCTDLFARPGRELFDGVPVSRFRYVFPWLGLSGEEREAMRLKGGSPLSFSILFGLWFEKDVSLIHTHVQHRLGGVARTVARLKRVPYVVSLHGGYFTLPDEQIQKMSAPFRGKLEWGKAFGWLLGSRNVLRDADGILCVGYNEYEEVQKRFPGSRVYYVPNGVKVKFFASAEGELFREAYGISAAEHLVLCVSRIDYQKNQVGLVRAFAQFVKGHPDHKLVLIGAVTAPDYRRELAAEIVRHQLESRVIIVEGLREDDPLLASAYKAAEQFVLPSHHEPFGIVVLEAWAAGIPVVAYGVGGIPGFATSDENILLVNLDDEKALVQSMSKLAANPELRKKICDRAFEKVRKQYDWSVIAEKVRAIYEEIAG